MMRPLGAAVVYVDAGELVSWSYSAQESVLDWSGFTAMWTR